MSKFDREAIENVLEEFAIDVADEYDNNGKVTDMYNLEDKNDVLRHFKEYINKLANDTKLAEEIAWYVNAAKWIQDNFNKIELKEAEEGFWYATLTV